MTRLPEGDAIVYCQDAFKTTNGKTAHGLVRFTRRYRIGAVIDAQCAGGDAGVVLDGTPNRIPITADLKSALDACVQRGFTPAYFIVGLAPDGGRLSETARMDVKQALDAGLNIDSGLHDYLSQDAELVALARKRGVVIRDIRKPPSIDQLHFFSGAIASVRAFKIAVLGTDSAVGKRTTAWLMVQGFEKVGQRAELIGTGQTAWLQGARYGVIMDSLVNDFVAGEIEHAVTSAWEELHPDVIVIEGQGSLMNPAYPGGFEILAAARPDVIVLQHAPARREYDGFPGYPIQPLARQIEVIELLCGKPIVAITLNHENLSDKQVPLVCEATRLAIGLPVFDVLQDGPAGLIQVLAPHRKAANDHRS
jgi:uncharacterized NAD-dependent epimerase/dehydratase family protein